ncbi:sigma-70 family RNA polymerase sigma factor [Agromyces mediolanus]|uniref:sigma-70 family RNA polymerase sigma factor n=1 Tax=Agromyces mediolanus TaxID=41986 RepID=UPI003838BE6C
MSRRSERERRVEAAVATNLDDLLAYAERRVANRADAADALGDALEIVWRRSAKLPAEPLAARKYLFGVLRNVMLNTNRANRRGSVAVQRLRAELAVAPRPDFEVRLDVQAAVAALPAAQAELVRLVHWDGFSLADAAELLGLNASTARGRYATARAALQAALTEQDRPLVR